MARLSVIRLPVGVCCILMEHVEADKRLHMSWLRFAGRMREANEACYAVVRTELRTLFGSLCKNKSADLILSGTKARVIYVLVFLMSSTVSAYVGVKTSFVHGIARPLVEEVAVCAVL